MKLSIYSPQRKLLHRLEVKEVTLTGSEGEIQILPSHANLVGTIEAGKFAYVATDGGGAEGFEGFASAGFFEVADDHVSVVAETMELASEIDLARAKDAEKRALEKLGDPSISVDQIGKYQRKLQRAIARQSIAK